MKKIASLFINSYKGLSNESWMLAVVMLINRAGSMVLPFLGIYMTDVLGFSFQQVGFALSCFGIGSVIGSYAGGWLTDKLGEFKVQTTSLILSAPMFLLLIFFKSFESISLIILIQSIISETFRPANSVAITKHAKPKNITRSFSLNRMAINLGFSIGPSLGGILSGISYDFLFIFNSLTYLLAGLVYYFYFRNKKHKNSTEQAESVDIKILKQKERSPYRDWIFIAFCLFCTFFSIAFFQFFNTLPLFYREVAQLSPTVIGLILGFNGLLVVSLEMILVHYTEKRFTVTQIIAGGSILSALSYTFIGIDHSLIFIFLSMIFLSVGEILALPFMSTVTAMRSGVYNKGAYMGLNGMSFSLAFIIAPTLCTYIADRYGFDILWFGSAIMLLFTAIGFYLIIPKLFTNSKQKTTI
ncbi:MFS transporter [Vaginella massiliensis]|uniref:MFS transporter n=1 Tax=Vaginella massiliensis TaxID=1816680 RepID=UPI0037526202